MRILKVLATAIICLAIFLSILLHYEAFIEIYELKTDLYVVTGNTSLFKQDTVRNVDYIVSSLNNMYASINAQRTLIDYLGRKIEVPNYETLFNATVIVFHKCSIGTGVCVDEDENNYYILTARHVIDDEYTIKGKGNSSSLIATIPESNLGMSVKVETIREFIGGIDKSLIPAKMTHTSIAVIRDKFIVYPCEVIKMSDDYDLAYIRISKRDGLFIEKTIISLYNPEIGNRVYIVGHPMERFYNLSAGVVSNLDSEFMVTDAFTTFGNSGGGVFNKKGELIGIVSRVACYGVYLEDEE